MYSHGILVMFVVLLANCLNKMAHQRKDFICACTHHGSSVLGPLCHVHFRSSPAGCSLYWISEMSWQSLITLFIGCSWQALMDLYALKRTSLEATRSLNVRTTPQNNDFTALFFWQATWPSIFSGSTVTIVSHAKTSAAHLFVQYRY